MEIPKELVQQWAKEAGFEPSEYGLDCTPGMYAYNMDIIHSLVTRAMAEQAEADAALCKKESRMHLHLDRNGRSCHIDYANVAETCADAILANKPTLDN